jgi:hypothetical protein
MAALGPVGTNCYQSKYQNPLEPLRSDLFRSISNLIN